MSREGSPIMRCPSSVQRGAQLIAREFASALISAGQEPKDFLPFVRVGIETVDEVADIVVPKSCVSQVLNSVLSVQNLQYEGQEELLRK